MSFLWGLLKRKKEISLIRPMPQGIQKKETLSGNWFIIKKKQTKENISPYFGGNGLGEFLDRYQHFGLAVTLLSYILPSRYQKWLLVIEDLEKRGWFQKFYWSTRLGTGDVAETAFLYGMTWSIKSGILAYLTQKFRFVQKPVIEVFSNFQGKSLDTVFDCIFRVKLGYIIIAAFTARLRHRLLKGGVSYE